MNYFYHLEDALKEEKKIKTGNIISILLFIFTLSIVFVLTSISTSTIIMVLDIFVTTYYAFYLITYILYYRKKWKNNYHFLAKIQHYEHETIIDSISAIDTNTITYKDRKVNTIALKSKRVLYIEAKICTSLTLELNQKVAIEIVDHFVIGYEAKYE